MTMMEAALNSQTGASDMVRICINIVRLDTCQQDQNYFHSVHSF